MVASLDRKLLRDLWLMRGQATAIGMVIACGVATFVLSLSMLRSLELTLQTYYDRYRFPDVFTHVERAPDVLEARLAAIPGVQTVETRIVESVNLQVDGLSAPAVGRIVSLPDTGPPNLARLHLRAGRWLAPRRDDEVLASEAFTKANGLHVGDHVTAVINGRWRKLRIVGIALSPEFVYEIQPGDLLPDNRHFGVFWMSHEALAAAYRLEGAFNDVLIRTMRGASEAEVIKRLDQLTEPYGGLGAYGRDDHPSHEIISNEIDGLRGMGMMVPTIFLAVAAFLLNIVLGRLIGLQREQIAALKAFGYFDLEVGWHYWKLVLGIAVAGTAVGIALGAWMGKHLTLMYAEFFHFPVFTYQLGSGVIAISIAVAMAAALCGTGLAVVRAVRLPPAEAMRPEAPATYRPIWFERLGLRRWIPAAARMVLRQLQRHPFKSGMSVMAISLAVAVLVLGNFMEDSVDELIDAEFFHAQRFDMTVTMFDALSEDVRYELSQLPGVHRAEVFRTVAARIRSGHHVRRVAIMGLDPKGTLRQLVQHDRSVVSVPEHGLLLSAKLAEILEVRPGQQVRIEVLEGRRPIVDLPVAATVDDFSGLSAYTSRSTLQRLMQEGPVVSGAFLSVDPLSSADLYRQLKEAPNLAATTVQANALNSFRDTIVENQMRMKTVNVIFACVLALGVVYNAARISLTERSRELATLRVIGFTRWEISAILLGEMAVLTVLAIPLGLLVGYGFAMYVSTSVNQELFRIPLAVDRSTFGFAAAVVILASAAAGLLVRRRLDELDLVAVLKARE